METPAKSINLSCSFWLYACEANSGSWCSDTLSAEAKPKVDDKASSKAGSTTEAAAALPEPGASLKYPSDAKAARPALGGLLRLNAHKDAAAQQVRVPPVRLES